jgi:hypothetical protein
MEKYPILGVVRSILFVGGWITIVVAVLIALSGLVSFGQQQHPFSTMQAWMQLGTGLLLAISGAVAVGLAELLSVLVNIEVNTRARRAQ